MAISTHYRWCAAVTDWTFPSRGAGLCPWRHPWLMLLLLVWCASAIASPTQRHVVYRVDDRYYGVAFEDGFRAWGNNDSIDQHMSGTSIRDRTSAWIATTTDEDTARRIARARFMINPSIRTQTTWIYEIAQTPNMYDFHRVLTDAQSAWFMSTSRREHLNALQTIYEPQREIGARDRIEAAQIVRAREVMWDEATGREVWLGQWVDNPNYDPDRYRFSQMSPNLYPFDPTLREIIGIASTVAFYAVSWCIGSQGTLLRHTDEMVCSEMNPLSYTDKEVMLSQQARANYFPYHDL